MILATQLGRVSLHPLLSVPYPYLNRRRWRPTRLIMQNKKRTVAQNDMHCEKGLHITLWLGA